MSSYLEKQQAAFVSGAMSAAPKISNKRTFAAPAVSAPSPAPSNASSTSKTDNRDLKRKREPTNVVYSQPAATGYGLEVMTQIQYVVDFLKKKDEAKTFREILEYLSQMHIDESQKRTIIQILKRHGSVQWIQDPKSKAWDSGTFKHRPKINVRTKKDLIAYLQIKTDAQGVSVKDLKDGWPDCEDAINELEAEHKILVTRTKKDNHARMIWGDDLLFMSGLILSFTSSGDRLNYPAWTTRRPVKTRASVSSLPQSRKRRRRKLQERESKQHSYATPSQGFSHLKR
ncbi:hypothetical protein B0O99DRAFT_610379 [Bisporella sp. PMI_857]|nr:hypothetical protein B0O99DRAFT_612827 [Bisporella sp. PMI_857]KAH8600297.1 hypothetical protein B0O99DRAFT_610379 [Bisporella sp. PMI_857]